MTPDDAHRALARALSDPACYPHPVAEVRIIETHISRVLLTGQFAYKLKRPVALGFLDFTRLEDRLHYCREELRLNRRLAPEIYLDVVAIAGPADAPRIDGTGAPLEYAVKMREFAQDALFDRMLREGRLGPSHIDALAARIAAFHAEAPRADASSGHGTAQAIEAPMLDNFAQLRALRVRAEAEIGRVEAWSRAEHARLEGRFAQRLREGWVRECHGDLHLGNIAWVGDRPQVFDCIEFNPEFRWIDTVNEAAFLTMDLASRGRMDFSARFLNDYLELGGDYGGLGLLRYYQVYRALVRAKVSAIRASQADAANGARTCMEQDCDAHLRLALELAGARRGAIVLMHGLSGSGKSHLSQALVESLGAVRVRSDVERKRLQGLAVLSRSGSGVGSGLYARARTRETYARLGALALAVSQAGYAAIVDAASLERWQRDAIGAVARDNGLAFVIVSCVAPQALLRSRLTQRASAGGDASEATGGVLDWQLGHAQPLSDDEAGETVEIDTGLVRTEEAVARIRARLAD